MSESILQEVRRAYVPKLPPVFAENGMNVTVVDGEITLPEFDTDKIQELFPNTCGLPIITFQAGANETHQVVNVGVILSGGQAPGGHNVIAGIFDGLKALNPDNKLYGFLGGPSGLIDNEYMELTTEIIDEYRNTGGFDMIRSGRTKLETEPDFDKVKINCDTLGVNAIVIIGGDDSNTNACILAEYYARIDAGIQVIGCPKTIDGDLKHTYIETSFGFDTACKVYSELIGNICRDAMSSQKYWHFIKLMGRSASHIALECSLLTQPSFTLVSEEVEEKDMTLDDVVSYITDIVKARAAKGWNFGVGLIPEGLIEFIPDLKILIGELNDLQAHDAGSSDKLPTAESVEAIVALGLTSASATAYFALPIGIKKQLVLDRDPHGNVMVSMIETEKLLMDMVKERLSNDSSLTGKFSAMAHFFGYEGRCSAPSNFDADYCYGLGYSAAALIDEGKTGYISSIRNLTEGIANWVPGGIPVTALMNVERRHGEDKPVIRKALVELDGKPFAKLAAHREEWATSNSFLYPGPIQYFGPEELCDKTSNTLQLEQE